MSEDDSRLLEFIEAAKAHGASDASLTSMFRQRGWPAKSVQASLARYYELKTGIGIPAHSATGESARDAFLYLVVFSSLGIWAFGLVSLVFTLLDRWMPDALQPAFGEALAGTNDMAKLFIAFPVFLGVMRVIGKSEATSASARWLTYISLFLTATTASCDLVVAVEYLLRGEVTLRFALKVLTILLVTGGIFAYFFERLRSSRPSRWQRPLAMGSVIAVVAALFGGFANIGTPHRMRVLQADHQRTRDLKAISEQMRARWTGAGKLPDVLVPQDWPSGWHVDPETRQPYQYNHLDGPNYQLCATFGSRGDEALTFPGDPPGFWSHGEGKHCYTFNATAP